jgi:drug/metabolite transporter (DMT)-like permease
LTKRSCTLAGVGPVLCLFSAACFGAMPIFGKLAYQAGVPADALLLLRFSLAAVLLGAVLLLRPGLRATVPAPRGPRCGRHADPGRRGTRMVLTALGLGAVGYATQSTLYFAALERLDAPMVALVVYTYPVLVTLAAVALRRDRLTRRRIVALGVSSTGTLLVLLGADGVSLDALGVALAFAAAVTYTAYILVSHAAVQRLPPAVLSAWVMTGAAAALAVRAFATGRFEFGFGLAGWFWVAALAVVSTVFATLAFFAGLRSAGPSTAAILSTFEPVVTTALAAVVLAEFLTPLQLIGALIVLASIAVLQRRPRRGDHATATRTRPAAPDAASDPLPA